MGGDKSALAAKAATTTIPIVFAVGTEPIRSRLVTSLRRPGGNVTGVSAFIVELEPKRLELQVRAGSLFSRNPVAGCSRLTNSTT
jgi:putative tryptophan/tyrosine transport system substrate-binding protein